MAKKKATKVMTTKEKVEAILDNLTIAEERNILSGNKSYHIDGKEKVVELFVKLIDDLDICHRNYECTLKD